jgi:hypothetical protein
MRAALVLLCLLPQLAHADARIGFAIGWTDGFDDSTAEGIAKAMAKAAALETRRPAIAGVAGRGRLADIESRCLGKAECEGDLRTAMGTDPVVWVTMIKLSTSVSVSATVLHEDGSKSEPRLVSVDTPVTDVATWRPVVRGLVPELVKAEPDEVVEEEPPTPAQPVAVAMTQKTPAAPGFNWKMWTAASVAVAATGAGVGFLLRGDTAYGAREDGCGDCSGRTGNSTLAAGMSFGVAAAAAGLATYFYLTDGPEATFAVSSEGASASVAFTF